MLGQDYIAKVADWILLAEHYDITEGCNNKTKVLKRISFGVRNFSRFRNRVLHCI